MSDGDALLTVGLFALLALFRAWAVVSCRRRNRTRYWWTMNRVRACIACEGDHDNPPQSIFSQQ